MIYKKAIEQFYDPVKEMFLADRYIKGECPNCGAKDQYGDACENCSTSIRHEAQKSVLDLVRCKAVLKSSEHYFFRLSDPKCTDSCASGLQARPSAASNREQGEGMARRQGDKTLADWDISRDPRIRNPDSRYQGREIPLCLARRSDRILREPEELLASARHRLRRVREARRGQRDDPLHRKDIIYFHTLFCRPMLQYSGYKTPDSVYVHGFITVSGDKMSKSRGRHRPAALSQPRNESGMLRYYIAQSLAARRGYHFNPDDFWRE